MAYLKQHFLTLILLIAVIFLALKDGCGKPDVQQPTVVTGRDSSTTQVPQPTIIVLPSTPQVASSQAPIVIPQQYQPSGNYEALLKQYNELATKHLTTNNYRDSVQLKDTAGNRVGVFTYNDFVSENQIKTRQPSYQLSFPRTVVNTTTTITQPYQPTRQVYLGGELSGTTATPLNGAYLGLMYKDRKDGIYAVKAGGLAINGTIVPHIQIGKYWKLKLGK